jgi:dihydrofolate reductase
VASQNASTIEEEPMRKIVASLFVSLDGVVEAPETWHFPYFNDEMGQIVGDQMAGRDTMLLGRRTYEEFAKFWPDQTGDIADEMNGTPKLVASTTLDTVEWANSTLIKGDVGQALTALKRGPGKDISIVGSATLVRSLLGAGVLDELHLLVHPIVVGRGQRLFADEPDTIPLQLAESTTLSTGVLSLSYARADKKSRRKR